MFELCRLRDIYNCLRDFHRGQNTKIHVDGMHSWFARTSPNYFKMLSSDATTVRRSLKARVACCFSAQHEPWCFSRRVCEASKHSH